MVPVRHSQGPTAYMGGGQGGGWEEARGRKPGRGTRAKPELVAQRDCATLIPIIQWNVIPGSRVLRFLCAKKRRNIVW